MIKKKPPSDLDPAAVNFFGREFDLERFVKSAPNFEVGMLLYERIMGQCMI